MKQNGKIFTSQKNTRLGKVFSRWNICLIVAMLCINATCERPLDLDLDLPDPQLVVISNFTLGEPVKVRLSKSQHILDETPSEYLAHAVVTLFEGDRFLEELKLVIDSDADRIPPYYITENFIPEHSVTYTIVVEADGFETVTAHSFIPVPVHIDEFSVSELSMRTGVASGQVEFSYDVALNFTDPEDEENYYHLNFYQEILDYMTDDAGDTAIIGRNLLQVSFSNLDNSNYVEAFIGGGVLLKENPFDDGLTFSLRLSINPNFELLGKVYAELRTVSAEYFNFHTSISRQQEQPNDPFQTEIIIFDNIMNGQGVFAGYNITLDSTILDIN